MIVFGSEDFSGPCQCHELVFFKRMGDSGFYFEEYNFMRVNVILDSSGRVIDLRVCFRIKLLVVGCHVDEERVIGDRR